MQESPRFSVGHIVVSVGLLLSGLLIWFASGVSRDAHPVAHLYLQGIALSLGQVIESVTFHDPSLLLLSDFNSADIAYFTVIDRNGIILFHTNPDLISEQIGDERWKTIFVSPVAQQGLMKLGTGETVFESQQQLHLASGTLGLRLALHTWRSDQIVQRSHVGSWSIMALLLITWLMGFFLFKIYRYTISQREELANQAHLAQLGTLGAVMAHEVRTPLAGIKGYAQLLEEQLEESRLHRFTQKIVAEVTRLEALVNELLTYSHQGAMSDGLAVVDEVLASAWEQIGKAAEENVVNLDVQGVLEHPVRPFPDRLRQVLLNILMNAVQAMPDGGTIRVRLIDGDEYATVLIADQGGGFGEDTLKKAFDPFYTTRTSGSGLGLAVCHKIVEGYGGMISIENSKEGGAVITLVLPLAKELV